MLKNSSEYQMYLCSREWAVLREQVRKRSGNKCERCCVNPQQAVHHLTYERLGYELLTDLQAICNPCHEFLSGKSNVDPRPKIKMFEASEPTFYRSNSDKPKPGENTLFTLQKRLEISTCDLVHIWAKNKEFEKEHAAVIGYASAEYKPVFISKPSNYVFKDFWFIEEMVMLSGGSIIDAECPPEGIEKALIKKYGNPIPEYTFSW